MPPGTDAEKDVVAPEQTNGVPEIVTEEYTVINFVAKRVPMAYVIVAVPVDIPVTMPADETEAIDGLLLLHMPQHVLSVSVMPDPMQVTDDPSIGAIDEVATVKGVVTEHPPTE